jgi:hypothetical protein
LKPLSGGDAKVRVQADQTLMERVLGNLLDNALKFVRRKEAVGREILGKDFDASMRLLERAKQIRSGRIGTTAADASTGSALPGLLQLTQAGRQAARAASGDLVAAGNLAKDAAGWVSERLTRAEAQALMEEALLDPAVALDILRTVPRASMASWSQRMAGHVGRAAARAAAFAQDDEPQP